MLIPKHIIWIVIEEMPYIWVFCLHLKEVVFFCFVKTFMFILSPFTSTFSYTLVRRRHRRFRFFLWLSTRKHVGKKFWKFGQFILIVRIHLRLHFLRVETKRKKHIKLCSIYKLNIVNFEIFIKPLKVNTWKLGK